MYLIDNLLQQLIKVTLNPTSWQVLLLLLSNENLENIPIDIKTLANGTGLCYNTVVRSLRILVDHRIIIRPCLSMCYINNDTNNWIYRIEPKPKEIKEVTDSIAKPVAPANPLFDTEGFRKFLAIYPRHRVRLKETLGAWTKLNPSPELAQTIIERVEKFKTSDEWKKDKGKWIPSIYNFIANERWRDEMTYTKDWQEI